MNCGKWDIQILEEGSDFYLISLADVYWVLLCIRHCTQCLQGVKVSDVISATKCLTTGSLVETKPWFIVLLISVVLISPLWPISRYQHDITEFRVEKRFAQSALTSWSEPAPAHYWIFPALMDPKSDNLCKSSSNIAEGLLAEGGDSSPANCLFAVCRYKAICRSGSSGNQTKVCIMESFQREKWWHLETQLWVMKVKSKMDFRASNSVDKENSVDQENSVD